nr:hypothetical protein CFP56_20869 [Quercus suber]
MCSATKVVSVLIDKHCPLFCLSAILPCTSAITLSCTLPPILSASSELCDGFAPVPTVEIRDNVTVRQRGMAISLQRILNISDLGTLRKIKEAGRLERIKHCQPGNFGKERAVASAAVRLCHHLDNRSSIESVTLLTLHTHSMMYLGRPSSAKRWNEDSQVCQSATAAQLKFIGHHPIDQSPVLFLAMIPFFRLHRAPDPCNG